MTERAITRLSYKEKVSVVSMRDILKETLKEHTTDEVYDGEKSADLTKKLADAVRDKLKLLGHDRYKFIVQVVIGECRDQGIRSGTRCFWDASTDVHATETIVNDNCFYSATAWAVYLY